MSFPISTVGPGRDVFGNIVNYKTTLRLCNDQQRHTPLSIDYVIQWLEQEKDCIEMHIELTNNMPDDSIFRSIKQLWKYIETSNAKIWKLTFTNDHGGGYKGWLPDIIDAISLNTNITELTLVHHRDLMSYETTLSLANLIKANNNITMLAIECSKIEPMIYEALVQNTTIKHLSISYANHDPQSFIALHRYLCKTTTLTDITLRGNNFYAQELYHPVYIFNCRSIRNINLQHCSRWRLQDIYSIPASLRRIVSSDMTINDTSSHAFVKQLTDNYSITEFNIALVPTMQILIDDILQRNRLLVHEDMHMIILNYVIVMSSIVRAYDGINAYLIVDILDLIDEQIYRIMPRTKVDLVLKILQSIDRLR